MIQILYYKSCIIRYVFKKDELHNKGKSDWRGKEVVNKRKKDLHIRDYKSWYTNCDLYNKKVINKKEKDLCIRNYKS